MSFSTKKIVFQISNRHLEIANALKTVKINSYFQGNFQSSDFRSKEIISPLIKKQIENLQTPVIYKINCENIIERESLVETYRKFHSKNKTLPRDRDRYSVARFNDTGSETLYIGSKMKNISGRIIQHLIGGNPQTFCLHLNKWDNNLKYNLSIELFKITNIETVFTKMFVESIEQEFWDYYKPVFGKKSGL